jgi:DNA (cytosine-5)-methyltransferase 1
MAAYYNEHDPKAAAWLRELIKAGLIAPGEVDERSIEDVVPNELNGFTQCHFFAGIGVWSYALRLAGWPDDRPVWTGSCPCQPFSAAGKRGGTADERHLWPAFQFLIEQCRPAIVLGEQVASKDGLAWLDTVYADLEASGYAVGAADLCAAGIGAPHIRQRLWFVGKRLGHSDEQQWHRIGNARPGGRPEPADGRATGGMADADDARLEGWRRAAERADQQPVGAGSVGGGLADTESTGEHGKRGYALRASGQELRPTQERDEHDSGSADGRMADARSAQKHEEQQGPAVYERKGGSNQSGGRGVANPSQRTGPTNGHWRSADWLYCRDGKWRPVEPGTFPLAHGAPARVGRLRGYGNAIVAQAAQAFIESVM